MTSFIHICIGIMYMKSAKFSEHAHKVFQFS